MSVGVVSKRYAKALLEYSIEHGAEDAMYGHILQLAYTLGSVKALSEALRNPSVNAERRVELICNAAGPSPLFERFATLVVKEEREELLLFIAHSFIALYQKRKNILPVKLTTAVPAPSSLEEYVATSLAALSGATVKIENVVDSSIIGGFVVETEATRLDASVEGRLRSIRNKLVEQNRKLV